MPPSNFGGVVCRDQGLAFKQRLVGDFDTECSRVCLEVIQNYDPGQRYPIERNDNFMTLDRFYCLSAWF